MKNTAAQELGKLGGQKTARRGRDYYAALGKKGMAKRWGKKTWYWEFSHWECPVCGHDRVYRTRVYKTSESGHQWNVDSTHSYYCNG